MSLGLLQELRLLGVLSSSKKRPPKVVNKRKYVRRLFVTKPKSLLRAHNEICILFFLTG